MNLWTWIDRAFTAALLVTLGMWIVLLWLAFTHVDDDAMWDMPPMRVAPKGRMDPDAGRSRQAALTAVPPLAPLPR
jgi:hypothetical protein